MFISFGLDKLFSTSKLNVLNGQVNKNRDQSHRAQSSAQGQHPMSHSTCFVVLSESEFGTRLVFVVNNFSMASWVPGSQEQNIVICGKDRYNGVSLFHPHRESCQPDPASF